MVATAQSEKLHGSPFFMWFCVASGIEKCKTLPPSDNADITSLFCADSNEQFGRRDNIRISGVEKFKDELVYERVLEVASDIGVTISKQDISLCHHLPSRNPGSRPIIAKFVRRETKFGIMAHKGN